MRSPIVMCRYCLVILALLGVFPACGENGEGQTGVILQLVANTDLNTEQELMEQLSSVEILLDADGGFLGLEGEPTTVNGFWVYDFDADDELELLMEADLDGPEGLPRGRLGPGSNLDKRIGVRVRGLDAGGQPVAVGGIEPKRLFQEGEMREEEIPVNLLGPFLPPRIVAVTPHRLPELGSLGSIAFYASKPLSKESFAGHVHVFESGKESEEIQGRVEGPRDCPFGTQMYTFVPNDCYGNDHLLAGIVLRLDPQVTDEAGRGIRDEAGTLGFKRVLDAGMLSQFGHCVMPIPCELLDLNQFFFPQAMDTVCEANLFQPAPCTVVANGCEDSSGSNFAWVRAESAAECQAYRSDTLYVEGGCVIDSPAEACDSSSCTDGTMVCVDGECMSSLGGCAADCGILGGCPAYDQRCQLLPPKSHTCR